MKVDIEFLRDTYNARLDVGRWLNERPNRGLDVTDVATVVAGYDYLVHIIKEITGEDLLDNLPKAIPEEESNIKLTILD
jgi:hypothetical protein